MTQLPTATEITKLTPVATDVLFSELEDLVNLEFKAWYCKSFVDLGRDKVLRLASVSRQDGKNPQRYFSFLIRKELNEQTAQNVRLQVGRVLADSL